MGKSNARQSSKQSEPEHNHLLTVQSVSRILKLAFSFTLMFTFLSMASIVLHNILIFASVLNPKRMRSANLIQ